MPISIMNLDRNERLNPVSLFGEKDARKFVLACEQVMHDWLYPYEGCYRASKPHYTIPELKAQKPADMSVAQYYKQLNAQWYAEHPGEEEKEVASKKEWERKNSRAFKAIFGVAKRHGLYIKWFGDSSPCCGDQWEITKLHHHDLIIGRVSCW